MRALDGFLLTRCRQFMNTPLSTSLPRENVQRSGSSHALSCFRVSFFAFLLPLRLQECLRECPQECPGCLRECLAECLQGPSGPGLRSAQKVSRECPRSVEKVFQTLRGHSRDTFWTLRSPGPEGPRRHSAGTLPETPRTLLGTPPETLRARRARETPVAGRGGVAIFALKKCSCSVERRAQHTASRGAVSGRICVTKGLTLPELPLSAVMLYQLLRC